MAGETTTELPPRFLEEGAVEVATHNAFDSTLEDALNKVEDGLVDRFVIATSAHDEGGRDTMVVTLQYEAPLWSYGHDSHEYRPLERGTSKLYANHLVVRKADEQDTQDFGIQEGALCIDATVDFGNGDFNRTTVPVDQQVDINYQYATYPAVKQLRLGQRLDDYPWVQAHLDKGWPNSNIETVRAFFAATQAALLGMQAQPERDLHSERETAALAEAVMGSGFWLRATETYDRHQYWAGDKPPTFFDNLDWRWSSPEPSDVIGMRTYSSLQLGADIGYEGEKAGQWFVAYRANNMGLDMPLHAITEVVEDSGGGHLLEGPTNVRPSKFHSYIRRNAG